MSTERIPAQVFHAAQYVADEAIARDWSIWDFVDRIGTLKPAVDVLAWELYAASAGFEDIELRRHCRLTSEIMEMRLQSPSPLPIDGKPRDPHAILSALTDVVYDGDSPSFLDIEAAAIAEPANMARVYARIVELLDCYNVGLLEADALEEDVARSSPPPSSSPATPPANHPLDGRTHYAECYRTRGHLDCAIEEIERLRQLVAGFTQADVDLLRCLWSSAQENGNPLSFEESNAADLASRIASLLPPSP